MGSVFKQAYSRRGRKSQSKRWYIQFRDHYGTRQRIAGMLDKRATIELLARIERLVDQRALRMPPGRDARRWLDAMPAQIVERLAQIGVIDEEVFSSSRPLSEHIKDFEAWLRGRDRTEKHVRLNASRIRTVLLQGARASRWSEVDPDRVAAYLAARRQDGLSARSSNAQLAAVKQFAVWMVNHGRASENPLARLSAVRGDVVRRRRTLGGDEIQALLDATYAGPKRDGLAGEERALCYVLALETGFRLGELRQLLAGWVDLDRDPPLVRLDAAVTKNRDEAVLPLSKHLAGMLRPLRARRKPTERLLPMGSRFGGRTLRADLEDAGIPYESDEGIADFHSLRHTFITALVAADWHPKTVQGLARHSNISLTMDRYAHRLRDSEVRAIESLPHYEPSSGSGGSDCVGSGLHQGGVQGGQQGCTKDHARRPRRPPAYGRGVPLWNHNPRVGGSSPSSATTLHCRQVGREGLETGFQVGPVWFPGRVEGEALLVVWSTQRHRRGRSCTVRRPAGHQDIRVAFGPTVGARGLLRARLGRRELRQLVDGLGVIVSAQMRVAIVGERERRVAREALHGLRVGARAAEHRHEGVAQAVEVEAAAAVVGERELAVLAASEQTGGLEVSAQHPGNVRGVR